MDALSATQAAVTELTAGDASPASQDSGSTDSQASSQQPTADNGGSPTTQGQQGDAAKQASTETGQQAPAVGPIPHDRHKAILENTRKEYDEKLAKLSWAEQFSGVEPRTILGRLRAAEAAERDPVGFITRYAQHISSRDPQKAEALRQALGQLQQPSQQQRDLADEPMPEPNVELEDGRKLYDSEQLRKLMEWQQARIEKRYGPIETQFKGQVAWNDALARNARLLADARTWDGWAENEAEIRAYMEKDGRATVHSAYRAVVIPKLKAERAKLEADIRKQLLDELNSKSSASTEQPGRSAVAAPRSYGRGQTADAVRDAISELSGR